MKIKKVNQTNIEEHGLYCVRNKKTEAYKKKLEWFKQDFNKNLNIGMAYDDEGNQLGFIEFIPAEQAWRPIKAENYLFIQCIMVHSKKDRNKKVGTLLIQHCEEIAEKEGKDGICVLSSKGSWLADKTLFEKNGFKEADKKGRFELMSKAFNPNTLPPTIIDYEIKQKEYKGWQLIYADQCPWHEKSVSDLIQAAKNHKIELKVTQLKTPEDAQNAPSGYGTFSLLKDGKLLADHYISKTRFENIIKSIVND